jgi:hypothetical protein
MAVRLRLKKIAIEIARFVSWRPEFQIVVDWALALFLW